MRKTKILATLGPSSFSKTIIKKMADAGMDALRLNTAYGDVKKYSRLIRTIRQIKDLPIVLDLKGPEIRIICDREYAIRKGEKIDIGFGARKISFNHKFHPKKGQAVLINDGLLKLSVISADENKVVLRALSNLTLRNNLRVNLPGMGYSLPILSKRDYEFIGMATKEKIDYLAISYTRNKEDVINAKKAAPGIDIIAKIETSEGVRNFDEILEQADGIMIARGDLGVEIPPEKLPMLQKEFIRKCNRKGKLVITATQMLESMISNPRPTRAETSDVANAILDGTDVVMLSGETAAGRYPVLAVKEMAFIAAEAENHVRNNVEIDPGVSVSEAISKAVFDIIHVLPITSIITLTRTGYTARMISRFRNKIDVFAITPSPSVKRRLGLYYGVTSFMIPKTDTRERIASSLKVLLKKGMIKKESIVLITAGVYAISPGATNLIEIHRVEELLSKIKG